MMIDKLLRAGLVGAVLATAATSAVAAPKPAPAPAGRAAAFQAVLDCRVLTDATARLACYDGAAAKMGEAEGKGDIIVVDRALATTVHREAFGLPVPSLDFLSRLVKPGEVDQVQGIVRSARADSSGHWTMALEDGAVWRQIDGQLMTDPKAGSRVAIRKGSLGSFLMNVDGHTAVKVHRDQ